MELAVIAVAFATIFVVELPDKTFIATLVLSTRYQPLAVWVGVGLAFLVQTALAVTVGSLATLLPEAVIKSVAAAIFLAGAFVLLRTAPGAAEEELETEEEFAAKATAPRTGLRAVGTSFAVLFTAEWGDLSQLLTISLVARYHDQLNVFLGAWAALLTVSGLAVLSGRWLLQHLNLRLLHYLGAGTCLLLAGVTVFELVTT